MLNYNTDDRFATLAALEPSNSKEEIVAAIAALRPTQEVPIEGSYRMAAPDEFKVGDLMRNYGFVGRIEKIRTGTGYKGLTVFSFALSYVSGDLSTFKFVQGSVCNGCIVGELATLQGNRNATFFRAIQ